MAYILEKAKGWAFLDGLPYSKMQLFLKMGGNSNNWNVEVINNARMEVERETAELSWCPRFFPAKPYAWQDIPRYPNNFRVCLSLTQGRLIGW